jgi:hypothetical protein
VGPERGLAVEVHSARTGLTANDKTRYRSGLAVMRKLVAIQLIKRTL